jgi:hypothetical protein
VILVSFYGRTVTGGQIDFFWIISYCAFSSMIRVKENIQPLSGFLSLKATRGDVTEMHGHARIWFVLSVMLLSSRGNHFLIQITCKIRPCEAWLCKLSYIEWESLLDMRIGNRTHTCRTSGRLLGPVSSTVSANT